MTILFLKISNIEYSKAEILYNLYVSIKEKFVAK